MDKEQEQVKLIQSLSLAINCLDDEIKHVQIVIVQSVEDKQLKCFFDVVDPSKIKLAEE